MISPPILSDCIGEDSPLSIALWVPRYWPAMGGTELHTHELSQRLAREHTVCVITHCDKNEKTESIIEQDIVASLKSTYKDGTVHINCLGLAEESGRTVETLTRLHRRHRWSRPLFSHFFNKFLSQPAHDKTESKDLIHYIYNGLSDSASLAASIAVSREIPFIFTPNILDTTNSPTAWNSSRFIKLYKKASRIITLTQFEKEYLLRLGVPEHKISIVPYGPILAPTNNSKPFREQAKLPDGKIVLFLGRLVSGKGYELLLKSRHQIWEKHPDTQLVFIGPTSTDARVILKDINDSRIHVYENSDQPFKTAALEACDLLCVPSSRESLGVVYIEAAACAKPVVALDIPVLKSVIQHNVDGYLVEHNAPAVATAVEKLLDDPALCVQFGTRALEKVRRLYQWDNITSAITDIYCESIKEQKQRMKAA